MLEVRCTLAECWTLAVRCMLAVGSLVVKGILFLTSGAPFFDFFDTLRLVASFLVV